MNVVELASWSENDEPRETHSREPSRTADLSHCRFLLDEYDRDDGL
jgi:hypothetical protein